jgi:LysM repeat protein
MKKKLPIKIVMVSSFSACLLVGPNLHASPTPVSTWNIKIDEGCKEIEVKKKSKKRQKKSLPAKYHRVSYGDSLWSLSQRYKTSVRTLRLLNAMTQSSKLIEDTRVKVQGKEPCHWRIRPGQNLYQISQVARVSFSELLNLNPQIGPSYKIRSGFLLRLCRE